jgi:hypothetical protein
MADPLATSADYADAMLVARRAKNWLFLLLLLMLLVQIAFFFIERYTNVIPPERVTAASTTITVPTAPAAATATTTQPTAAAATGTGTGTADVTITATPANPAPAPRSLDVLRYVSGIALFLGTILPILLAFVLLLFVNIMLIGRVIGVARVTGAFLWCLLLILLMVPWQVFFGGSPSPGDFRVPGVLYTWHDLRANAHFATGDPFFAVVKWARFFVMPLVAAIILLMVQVKSNRGLRQALGAAPAATGGVAAGERPDLNITV